MNSELFPIGQDQLKLINGGLVSFVVGCAIGYVAGVFIGAGTAFFVTSVDRKPIEVKKN